MEELNHFSHEDHPLTLSQVQKKVICYGCQEQILESEASYSCLQCEFFLHKRCAELPRQIIHPMHPQHPLILHKQPSYYYNHSCICNCCGRGWEFFTYNCSLCHFDLDVSCATFNRELKLEIHDHPLIQLRTAIFYCNVCCEIDKDSSYLCTICPFWIHKRCASLPKTLNQNNHKHPLLLAYSLPCDYRSFTQFCKVCHFNIHRSRWVYYCGPCRYFVHVTCVGTSQEDTEQPIEAINYSISEEKFDLEDQNQLIKLPSTRATQELITRFLLSGDECSSSSSIRNFRIRSKVVFIRMTQRKKIKKFYFTFKSSLTLSKKKTKAIFGHELSLSRNVPTRTEAAIGEEKLLLCDSCVEPISSSDLRYGCDNCGNYFLHVDCCKLPYELQITRHPEHPLKLMSRAKVATYFKCNACKRLGNGLQYGCKTCDFGICIKCASASLPITIAHNAHKHRLTQIQNSEHTACNGCGLLAGEFAFGCENCHFYLDYRCALLPPTTRQRWDRHPLILMYAAYFEHPDEFYCVICEHEINPNCWLYHCSKCDYSFHPMCIPRFGKFGNLKFEQTLRVDNHPSPLTHVPEARYNSCCAECGASLDWNVAYECEVCSFALCPGCANKREVLLSQNSFLNK